MEKAPFESIANFVYLFFVIFYTSIVVCFVLWFVFFSIQQLILRFHPWVYMTLNKITIKYNLGTVEVFISQIRFSFCPQIPGVKIFRNNRIITLEK